MTNTDGLSDLHEEIKVLEKWLNQSLGEKKAIFKDFDVQNKNELYAAAEKIQVTIKKKRIVTEHKILAGLTQWTKIEQEGHQYGYLLTGLICEMLKELISLPNSSSKDKEPITNTKLIDFKRIVDDERVHKKFNQLCYALKLLLQNQFKDRGEKKIPCDKITNEIKKIDEFNTSNFKEFLTGKEMQKHSISLDLDRYIEQFCIVCNELNNRELNSSKKLSIKDLIKRIKKEIDVTNHSGSSPIHIENDDTEVEIDEKSATILDPTHDDISKRASSMISDEKLKKIIQRREVPFVSNPLYLAPSLLHQVYNVLHDCYQDKMLKENSTIFYDQSSLALCGMMSLLTGLSPTIFKDINNLIEKGKILEKTKVKRIKKTKVAEETEVIEVSYYWVIDPKLNVNHSGIMSDKLQRYNKASTYKWHIPSAWIIQLKKNAIQELSVPEYNRFLRQLFKPYNLDKISCGILEKQIYFHLNMQTGDDLVAHLMANHDTNHVVNWSYEGRNIEEINRHFKRYIDCLINRKKGDLWKKEQHPGYIFDREQRIGSQRCWTIKAATQFFKNLYAYVQTTLTNDEANRIEKLNAYSIWMWHLSLICLTVRPTMGMPGLIKNYDSKSKFIYIHDKKIGSRQEGRLVPVVGYWQKHFDAYREYIDKTITALGMKYLQEQWKKNEFMLCILIHPQLTSKKHSVDFIEIADNLTLAPMSAAFVTHYLKETVQIYKNWPRHFSKNHLELSSDIHNTLYAHDSIAMGFGHTSSLSPFHYKTEIQQQVEALLKKLEILELDLFTQEKSRD